MSLIQGPQSRRSGVSRGSVLSLGCLAAALAASSCNSAKSSRSSSSSSLTAPSAQQDGQVITAEAGGNGSSAATKSASTAGTGSTSQTTPVASCVPIVAVLGKNNPWLAGAPNGADIDYSQAFTGVPADQVASLLDTAPAESPVLALSSPLQCLGNGNLLAFTVVGGQGANQVNQVAYDAGGDPTNIVQHSLGAWLGKSDIKAPLSSLLGVFLTAADPSETTPPATLDFSTQAARDYATLAPQIGQVFFIGTGTTAAGAEKQVTVPTGATRLYLALMDSYQWNNNAGNFNVKIQPVVVASP